MNPNVNVIIQRSEGVAALGIPRGHWEVIATEVVEIGISSRLTHEQPWRCDDYDTTALPAPPVVVQIANAFSKSLFSFLAQTSQRRPR